MATLTIADLDNGKRDLETVDAVANSSSDFTTTRYGDSVLTRAGALRRLGYQAPVPYASGLTVDSGLFTVSRDGVIYAPDPSLVPFTTAAWNAAQWRPVQNTANTNQVYQFPTLGAAEAAAPTLPNGSAVVVEGVSQGHVIAGSYSVVSGVPSDTVRGYAELLGYSGKNATLYVRDTGVAGEFSIGPADPSATPDGITIFCLDDNRIARRLYTGRVSALWAGAKGDGVADDTAALEKLVDGQFPEGVDGHGLTYKLNSHIDKTVSRFDWVNFKFTTPTVYATPVGIKLTCDRVDMDEIYVDGGRGTYKTGLEPYTVFTSHNGTQSIEPSHPPFFFIAALSQSAVVNIGSIHMENICAESGLLVVSLGRVTIGRQYFKNCANKTTHVYHTLDNGETTNSGSTHMETAYTEDCGILPDSFTVDGVTKSFSDNYALQGSFNLCVSFGVFTLGTAVVRQYGATAVTADRNKSFIGGTIDIFHDHPKAWSNNPSGAFWDEACDSVSVDKLKIAVMNRDPRDYTGGNDSSALQIYKHHGQKFSAAQLIIANNTEAGVVNRSIRMSVHGRAEISINGFNFSGASVSQTFGCDSLPDASVETILKFSNGYAAAGNFVLGAVKNLTFDNVEAPNSDLRTIVSGNPGVVGQVDSVNVSGGSFKSIVDVAGGLLFAVSDVDCKGDVLLDASVRRAAINGNRSIAGLVSVKSALSASVNDNTYIGNRVKIGDVRLFSVSNNTEIRTGVPAPAVWLSPGVATNVKGGTIIGNNLTITTGTVGAGFVAIPPGLASLVVVDKNTQTFTDA